MRSLARSTSQAKGKRKKKGTTSSVSSKEQPQHVVAGGGDVDVVTSAASSTLTREGTTTMAEEELGSIIEYAEDLADQEAPEPLPPGDNYEGQITKAVAKYSNTSGKKYAAVTFMIPIGQYPPDYPAELSPDGISIIYRMVPLEDNPRARFQCKRFVEAVGAKPGKRIDLNDWLGLSARLGIQNEEYEGIMREVITKVQVI